MVSFNVEVQIRVYHIWSIENQTILNCKKCDIKYCISLLYSFPNENKLASDSVCGEWGISMTIKTMHSHAEAGARN